MLLNYCEILIFLREHFTEKILFFIILAEKCLLPTIFKESSKLFIDDIFVYENEPDFKLIEHKKY